MKKKKFPTTVTLYLMAFLISLSTFLVFSFYLFLRRGYYNLYIVNKAVAAAALVLMGVVLLLGPLSRLYDLFDGWLKYRKELGIVAFFVALIHVVISVFFLSSRFHLSYFLSHPLSLLLGLLSVFLLVILFLESFTLWKKKLSEKTWWKLQNWGIRIAGMLAFFHVVVLKYQGWINWFTKGGSKDLARPYLPPASFFGFAFFAFIILSRLSEFLGVKIGRRLLPVWLVVLILVLVGSFVWGIIYTQ